MIPTKPTMGFQPGHGLWCATEPRGMQLPTAAWCFFFEFGQPKIQRDFLGWWFLCKLNGARMFGKQVFKKSPPSDASDFKLAQISSFSQLAVVPCEDKTPRTCEWFCFLNIFGVWKKSNVSVWVDAPDEQCRDMAYEWYYALRIWCNLSIQS